MQFGIFISRLREALRQALTDTEFQQAEVLTNNLYSVFLNETRSPQFSITNVINNFLQHRTEEDKKLLAKMERILHLTPDEIGDSTFLQSLRSALYQFGAPDIFLQYRTSIAAILNKIWELSRPVLNGLMPVSHSGLPTNDKQYNIREPMVQIWQGKKLVKEMTLAEAYKSASEIIKHIQLNRDGYNVIISPGVTLLNAIQNNRSATRHSIKEQLPANLNEQALEAKLDKLEQKYSDASNIGQHWDLYMMKRVVHDRAIQYIVTREFKSDVRQFIKESYNPQTGEVIIPGGFVIAERIPDAGHTNIHLLRVAGYATPDNPDSAQIILPTTIFNKTGGDKDGDKSMVYIPPRKIDFKEVNNQWVFEIDNIANLDAFSMEALNVWFNDTDNAYNERLSTAALLQIVYNYTDGLLNSVQPQSLVDFFNVSEHTKFKEPASIFEDALNKSAVNSPAAINWLLGVGGAKAVAFAEHIRDIMSALMQITGRDAETFDRLITERFKALPGYEDKDLYFPMIHVPFAKVGKRDKVTNEPVANIPFFEHLQNKRNLYDLLSGEIISSVVDFLKEMDSMYLGLTKETMQLAVLMLWLNPYLTTIHAENPDEMKKQFEAYKTERDITKKQELERSLLKSADGTLLLFSHIIRQLNQVTRL